MLTDTPSEQMTSKLGVDLIWNHFPPGSRCRTLVHCVFANVFLRRVCNKHKGPPASLGTNNQHPKIDSVLSLLLFLFGYCFD